MSSVHAAQLIMTTTSMCACPQPGMAACYANKTVAARLSMLQLETQVLQCQRIFYEATLAKLKASPGFAGDEDQQQHPVDEQKEASDQQQNVADHTAGQGLQVRLTRLTFTAAG